MVRCLKPFDKRQRSNTPHFADEKRITIDLFSLATTAEYRTIAHLFGVFKSSVCLIVKEVCAAIAGVLSKRCICIPQGADMYNNMLSFERKWAFPNCAGAIDGCPIPIISPTENHTDYLNHKGWHSILLQAVVDANYCFIDTCIGWPGRCMTQECWQIPNYINVVRKEHFFPMRKETCVELMCRSLFPVIQHIRYCSG